MGLATEALPADEVLPAAQARAREVNLAAPVSVAAAKRIMWANFGADLTATTRRENAVFAWLGRQADAKEGVQSFLEKRAPEWSLDAVTDFPEVMLGEAE